VNSRLFKWSLFLNPLQDKVTIVHCSERLHNNVDPLSCYPTSNSVTLTHVDETWQTKLWDGYRRDKTFKRVLLRLSRKGGTDKPPKTAEKSTQIEAEKITQTGETTTNLDASPDHPTAHPTDQNENDITRQNGNRDGASKSAPETKSRPDMDAGEMDEDDDAIVRFCEKIREQEATISDGTYSLIGRCLFFSDRRQGNLRLCIPESMTCDILKLCHDNRGHPGLWRTYTGIALRFYFPRMSRRVKTYVDDCQQC